MRSYLTCKVLSTGEGGRRSLWPYLLIPSDEGPTPPAHTACPQAAPRSTRHWPTAVRSPMMGSWDGFAGRWGGARWRNSSSPGSAGRTEAAASRSTDRRRSSRAGLFHKQRVGRRSDHRAWRHVGLASSRRPRHLRVCRERVETDRIRAGRCSVTHRRSR
jgi:hypothetical protein